MVRPPPKLAVRIRRISGETINLPYLQQGDRPARSKDSTGGFSLGLGLAAAGTFGALAAVAGDRAPNVLGVVRRNKARRSNEMRKRVENAIISLGSKLMKQGAVT